MIKCALRAREEYHHVLPGYTTKTRFGLYHGSDFHFPHFGTKKWVVGVYIDEKVFRRREKEIRAICCMS